MTPETCLGMKLYETLTVHEKICELADIKYTEFLEAYDEMLESYPEHGEQIAYLKERLKYAHELCVSRHTHRPTWGIPSHDDSYYEWLDEVHAREEEKMDGDFPLGNERDASFVNNFFETREIVYIQLGIFHILSSGRSDDEGNETCARKGFIFELYENWSLAVDCYVGLEGKIFREREEYCRERMRTEGKKSYELAQEYMASGRLDEVSCPLFCASEMRHPDAMVDLALAYIYGQFGIQKNIREGLELLRSASELDSERACFEIVELHDNGIIEVEGAEAQKMCERAAELGNKKAEQRLKRGFDTRPYTEILAERFEAGEVSSAWTLTEIYLERKEYELAGKWFDECIEAGYPEALVGAASVYLDKDGEAYNRPLAEQYLRRAASVGDVRAIIMLAGLELKDTDKPFWQTARTLEGDGRPDGQIFEQHKRQFAWYKLAADAGDRDAMENILVAYIFGYPTEQNYALAYTWAQRASELGSQTAAYTQAYLLENGLGTKKDVERALELYTRSAEAGIVSSMLRLYEIYRDGLEHILPDEQKSRQYLWMSGHGHS